MKKLIIMLAAMLPFLFVGCSEESKQKSFIERNLNDIGNGVYSFDIEMYNTTGMYSWNHSKIGMFFGISEEDVPFGKELIEYRLKDKNEEYIEEMEKLFIIDWFNTNYLFDKYEFVSQKHLYDIDIVSRVSKKSLEEHGWDIDDMAAKDEKIEEYEDHYIIIEKEKVPVIECQYKLDNDKIAKICLLKHPSDGYKIVQYTIDGESLIKR